MTRIVLLVALVAACSKDNPYLCDDQCKMMADAAVGPTGCTTSDDCSGATPVCNVAEATCVACNAADNGSCGNMLCSATNECQRCVSHDQCAASNACLASTGECLDPSTVAYVTGTGSDGAPCTKDAPCRTLSHAALQKPYVKLQSNIVETVSLQDVNVTVLAEPHTLISRLSGNDNAVVTIGGTSNVALTNVVITGGATMTGHGISVGSAGVNLTLDGVVLHANTGLGLVFVGGMLTMSRTLVTNNYGGGADIQSDFDITNTMFVANGTSGSSFGGLRILPHQIKHVFSFNTVANNISSDGPTAGINCSASMTVSATIVANNATNLCAFESSMFDTSTSQVGTFNNIQGLPAFKYLNASMPLSADYYRIGSTSAAIDAVTVPMTVMVDIDGDPRPQGGMRDIGADEYK